MSLNAEQLCFGLPWVSCGNTVAKSVATFTLALDSSRNYL